MRQVDDVEQRLTALHHDLLQPHRPLGHQRQLGRPEELADTSLGGFVVAARWADDRNWDAVRDNLLGRAPWFVRSVVGPATRRRIIKALIARDVWRAGPDACWRRFQLLLDSLEHRAPASDFWLGQRLSVADLGLFAHLHSLRTPLTAWQKDQIEARPPLRAYLDRVDLATRSPRQTG